MTGYRFLRTNLYTQTLSLALGAFCCLPAQSAYPQGFGDAETEKFKQLFNAISWEPGPAVARLGVLAELRVPQGYRFTGKPGAATWAEINQNPVDPNELGVLLPDDATFFLSFSYRDIGYVADDEKTKLDQNAILAGIQAATEAANAQRRSRGWSEFQVAGWLRPPAYDQNSHRLGWAIRGLSEGQDVGNYETRILGRGGVMSVTLVAAADQMHSLIPMVDGLLTGFSFTSGNKYGEWRSGDKVAGYGLTALITGGAAAASAKSGLLAKLAALLAKGGKAVVVGAAALLAAIAKGVSTLLARNKKGKAP